MGIFGSTQSDRDAAKNEWARQSQEREFQFNREEAQKNRDFQQSMFNQTNEWNLDMWNRQNAYNEEMYNKYQTPAALVQQYEAAGINPNMVAGANNQPLNFSSASSATAPTGAQATGSAPSASFSSYDTALDKIVKALGGFDSAASALGKYFGYDQQKANARLTNANAEAQEIANNKTKTEDAVYGASPYYMNTSNGTIVTGDEYDSLDDSQRYNYIPLMSNASNKGGQLSGSNSGALAAIERLTKLQGERSDTALKTLQNQLNDKVLRSQISDKDIMNALENMPVAQYNELIKQADKLAKEVDWNGQQIVESKANVRLIDATIANLRNDKFGQSLDQFNDDKTFSNFLKVVVSALHESGISVPVIGKK